jgi:hypothetical protein
VLKCTRKGAELLSIRLCTGLLNTTKIVLSAPLPRVFRDPGNGKVVPELVAQEQNNNLIGGDFKVEDLTRISKETVGAELPPPYMPCAALPPGAPRLPVVVRVEVLRVSPFASGTEARHRGAGTNAPLDDCLSKR